MVEESGTLESQLEATKVSTTVNLKQGMERLTSPGVIGHYWLCKYAFNAVELPVLESLVMVLTV